MANGYYPNEWRALGGGFHNIGRLLANRRVERKEDEHRRLREDRLREEDEFRLQRWVTERGGDLGSRPTIEGPGAMAPIEEQAPMPTESAIPGVRMPSTLPPQYETGTQPDPRYGETPGGKAHFIHPKVAQQEERDRRDAAVLMERQRAEAAVATERARLTGVYAGLPNVTGAQATALGGGAAAGVVFPTGKLPGGTPTIAQAMAILEEQYTERNEEGYETGYGLPPNVMYEMAEKMARGEGMPADPRHAVRRGIAGLVGGTLRGIGRRVSPEAPSDTLRIGSRPDTTASQPSTGMRPVTQSEYDAAVARGGEAWASRNFVVQR